MTHYSYLEVLELLNSKDGQGSLACCSPWGHKESDMNERLNWRKKYGLFDFDAEYIMWNAFLDESQVGIKIAGRNINNPRYADDDTLMTESEE